MRLLTLVLVCLATLSGCDRAGAIGPVDGPWRAWLDSPGGPLPFELEITRNTGREIQVVVVNGPERIEIPRVEWSERVLVLGIDHYDSIVTAELSADGTRLDGTWRRTAGPDETTEMSFHATAGSVRRFLPDATGTPSHDPIEGRWLVEFSGSEDRAVAVFDSMADGSVHGTFMTTVGDYRYLSGRRDGERLRLSCFDGAHAFLFDARLQTDGTLSGDFWSRDTWHETWFAVLAPDAALSDGFSLTIPEERVALESLEFLDLAGASRSLADPEFADQVRLLVIFGTWCPNCGDATAYFTELHRRYADRGLKIVGLAFEMTGNPERDLRQLELYARHHGIEYPLLLAGLADKGLASEAFPLVDRVRAYPTTLFVDAQGQVVDVYTGFSGPATGEAHQRLRREFEGRIERMLAGDPAGA